MSDLAIQVENISKAYFIGAKDDTPDTILGLAKSWIRSPLKNIKRLRRLDTSNVTDDGDDILWALRDVSFDVSEGEVLGIVGHNGAGKSTLLKILSRITEPTQGRITLNGHVASLLEVGTGFHPELSGRENIYMNGTILGMRKKEIDRKFDEIVSFSGVEKFLDTPIKRYSTGMKVRLAFSVAAHLEPEILVIDEVLSVGDAEFQRKCLGKMDSVAKEQGRTVLFVSHNLDAVLSLCNASIIVDQGRVSEKMDPEVAVPKYLAKLAECRSTERTDGQVKSLIAESEMGQGMVRTGSSVRFSVQLNGPDDGDPTHVVIVLNKNSGQRVAMFHTEHQGFDPIQDDGEFIVSCAIENLPLVPDVYGVDVLLVCGGRVVETAENICQLEVLFDDFFGTGQLPKKHQGCVLISANWKLARSS